LGIAQPEIILTDNDINVSTELGFSGRVVTLGECLAKKPDVNTLSECRRGLIDVDPLYVLFTSGSSGVPKGVVTAHRSVIDYIDVFAKTFRICSEDVFGNQAPLDYVAAIRDIYLPLHTGAKTVLIPKTLFSTPKQLFEYLNINNITTLCWVAPALSMCSEFGVFDEVSLESVTNVFFTGSVMPCKHLKVWQKNLPSALFVNHYGPTEITASCSYYTVNHLVSETENLPIGRPFENTDMFLLSDTGGEVPQGETGEICVRGTCLALGYYKDRAKTDESFIDNPLNTVYPGKIYKTGDLGCIDSDDVIHFRGRLDSQIKHMGHRVELGEIEAAALALRGMDRVCCLFHEEKSQICIFYTGTASKREVAVHLRERLPGYMIPRRFDKLEELPLLPNGKTDRGALKVRMGK